MNHKVIKIEIPKGYKVDAFDPETGELKFKEVPKDIKERIKTFDDVLEHLNISKEDFDRHSNTLSVDEIAYRKIKCIADALNEGWTPDWSNSNESKFYPWFKMGSPSGVGFSCLDFDIWFSSSYVGSRLCFKSRELAEYAGQQFENIYKDFLTVNQ